MLRGVAIPLGEKSWSLGFVYIMPALLLSILSLAYYLMFLILSDFVLDVAHTHLLGTTLLHEFYVSYNSRTEEKCAFRNGIKVLEDTKLSNFILERQSFHIFSSPTVSNFFGSVTPEGEVDVGVGFVH